MALKRTVKRSSVFIIVILSAIVAILVSFSACRKGNNGDPPVVFKADFAASPHDGVMPFTAQFQDETTGEPLSWQWDFQYDSIPDDSTRYPMFTYTDAGFYSVELVAKDADEADTALKIHYISVTTDAIGLSYLGSVLAEKGEEVLIPVTMAESAGLGAFTLKLIYDFHRIRIHGIESGVIAGIQSNINHDMGTVYLAWSSPVPAVIPAGGEFFGLRAEILDEIDSTMRHTVVGNPVEFADSNAVLLQGLELIFAPVHTSGQ